MRVRLAVTDVYELNPCKNCRLLLKDFLGSVFLELKVRQVLELVLLRELLQGELQKEDALRCENQR